MNECEECRRLFTFMQNAGLTFQAEMSSSSYAKQRERTIISDVNKATYLAYIFSSFTYYISVSKQFTLSVYYITVANFV